MSEMFGFDESTQDVKEFNYIAISGKEDCIKENIYFEEIKADKWEDGEIYLEVTVRDEKGKTCNRRYNIYKNAEDPKKETEKFKKIAKNIATKVLGENAELKGANFEDFCNKLVASIKAKPNWNKIPMRALFVHNKKGLTTLRSFSPVFELMTVPKEKSGLEVGNYDNFVAKQTPSAENSEFGATTQASTGDEIF